MHIRPFLAQALRLHRSSARAFVFSSLLASSLLAPTLAQASMVDVGVWVNAGIGSLDENTLLFQNKKDGGKLYPNVFRQTSSYNLTAGRAYGASFIADIIPYAPGLRIQDSLIYQSNMADIEPAKAKLLLAAGYQPQFFATYGKIHDQSALLYWNFSAPVLSSLQAEIGVGVLKNKYQTYMLDGLKKIEKPFSGPENGVKIGESKINAPMASVKFIVDAPAYFPIYLSLGYEFAKNDELKYQRLEPQLGLRFDLAVVKFGPIAGYRESQYDYKPTKKSTMAGRFKRREYYLGFMVNIGV